MKTRYQPCRHRSCNAAEHALHRRQFLSAAGLGAAAALTNLNPLTGLCAEESIEQAQAAGRRAIIVYLGGGASQLETWDPKPGRPTGGPYGDIETSVPGLRIGELLPNLATRMHHLAVVRSVNNAAVAPDHHGTGMHIGRPPDKVVAFPTLAEVITRELALADTKVPPHVELQVADTFRYETQVGPSLFGSQYAPLVLTGRQRPPNLDRLAALTDADHHDRDLLRAYLSRRFERDRGSDQAEAYSRTHAQVRGVMSSDELLDVDRAPRADLDRYGDSPLARHCLLARRLIESGVTVVKVRNTWWDTHADNFEGHRGLCGNLDHALALLLDDLADRGLLESTLVAVLSEFGRTPEISAELGRNHWPNAWSVVMGGCGLHGGALVGATNEDGTAVVDRQVGPAHLFATYYQALGIDPRKEYHVGDRPLSLADLSGEPIAELFT
jgi:hypothetical protein